MNLAKRSLSIITILSCLLVGCGTEEITRETRSFPDTNITQEGIIDFSKYIPTGSYKTSFTGSEMAPKTLFIQGDGTTYSKLNKTNKGYYVEKFILKDNSIYKLDVVRVPNISDINSIDSLSEWSELIEDNGKSSMILSNNKIDDGHNFEIIQVGHDLLLENIQLQGEYITVGYENENEHGKFYTICYYSEGLGLVRYESLLEGTLVEYYELESFN